MSDSIWTPAVIATIIYRVVMVIVGVTFNWLEYRRSQFQRHAQAQLHEEQHVDNPRADLGRTSGRHEQRLNALPVSRFRDHLRANSNNILASPLGIDGMAARFVPSTPPRPLQSPYFQTTSTSGRRNRITVDNPQTTFEMAPVPHRVSAQGPGAQEKFDVNDVSAVSVVEATSVEDTASGSTDLGGQDIIVKQ